MQRQRVCSRLHLVGGGRDPTISLLSCRGGDHLSPVSVQWRPPSPVSAQAAPSRRILHPPIPNSTGSATPPVLSIQWSGDPSGVDSCFFVCWYLVSNLLLLRRNPCASGFSSRSNPILVPFSPTHDSVGCGVLWRGTDRILPFSLISTRLVWLAP
jgi:hypothetical protein